VEVDHYTSDKIHKLNVLLLLTQCG